MSQFCMCSLRFSWDIHINYCAFCDLQCGRETYLTHADYRMSHTWGGVEDINTAKLGCVMGTQRRQK